MTRHRRRRGLLGWLRPGSWSVACRDARGRRAWLTVRAGLDVVVLECTGPTPVRLRPLDVGRLRGLLRDATVAVVVPEVPPRADEPGPPRDPPIIRPRDAVA